ncbi:MAG: DUF4956 domain-containing protein [Christensenellales bacterium]|jgi:hypothetical protein
MNFLTVALEGRLTFGDIIKNGIVDNFSVSNSTSIPNLLLAILVSFVLGMLIFLVYKRTFRGVLYSHSFNVSLVMLTMVTALIIRCITSNLTLSLGMVGALSIVRFRTAIKDPMDTVYMFWAVAAGILVGAGTGFYAYAIIGSAVISLFLYFMFLRGGKKSHAYLLIIRHDFNATNEVNYAVNRLPRPARLKSKAVTPNGVEITIELRLSGENSNIVNDLMRIEGVFDATLVSYQGEYAA